jgi:hypothetical protein
MSARLTLKVLRQLGVALVQPRRLFEDHLELIVTWENWRLAVARSKVAVPRSRFK